ncbi:alkaline phosphatase D family protein [Solimonas variicoloris]|uniref:alkaline phosphatase D family protein n=1 Tax=Solimonas variicoloris TaxID=254408 RepID=UPI0003730302|nr:alkaline phosphatase D family protein [Solimonas variicoloris]
MPGYNALTGQGAVAVEFTCMSVSSDNLADQSAATVALAPLYNAAVVLANPNVRFHNAAARGFVRLDITREQVSGEHWNVSTVLATTTTPRSTSRTARPAPPAPTICSATARRRRRAPMRRRRRPEGGTALRESPAARRSTTG